MRNFDPDDKIGLLREHLIEHTPARDLCQREEIDQNAFEQWKRRLFEKGAIAFEEETTIPPAIRHHFEEFAALVCAAAKTDGIDRFGETRNIVNHLEQAWQAEIAAGSSTDNGARRAIASFGGFVTAVACLQQPTWRRFMFFHDYRPHRMMVCLFFITLAQAQSYAQVSFMFHLYSATISLSANTIFVELISLMIPLLIFIIPSTGKVTYANEAMESVRGGLAGHFSHCTVKRLLAVLLLAFLGFQIISRCTSVPYYLSAASAWQVSLLQVVLVWLLTLVSVPAFAAVFAEAFFFDGPHCIQIRRFALAFIERCGAGRLLASR